MSNKVKLLIHFILGIFFLITAAEGLVLSFKGGDPGFEPIVTLGTGLLNMGEFFLAISRPSRSNVRRRATELFVLVVAFILVLFSAYWLWSVRTGEARELDRARVNLAGILATVTVVLLPLRSSPEHRPDRIDDDSARRRVLFGIQIELRRRMTPDLLPGVKLPIGFRLGRGIIDPSTPFEQLKSSGSIVDAYDRSGGRLLILGEAGAGKTTFGFQIINELASRAADELSSNPLPILLSDLSKWRNGQSFDEWLSSELRHVYRVKADIAAEWTNTGGDLALVLDGLETIRDKVVRRQFIRALAEYAQDFPSTPIVLLSRTDEYLETKAGLDFTTAILYPLTKKEVVASLDPGEPGLAYMRQVLEAYPDLFDVARQPFWLGLIASIGTNIGKLKGLKREAITARILDLFFERRLKDTDARTARQVMHGLGFIATRLKKQSIFFVDELDKNWLETFPQKVMYVLVPSLLAVLLGAGVAFSAYVIDIGGDLPGELQYLQGGELLAHSTVYLDEILAFIYSYIYLFIMWQPERPQKWRTVAFVHGVVLTLVTVILVLAAAYSTNPEFLSKIPLDIHSIWHWSLIPLMQRFFPEIFWQMALDSSLNLIIAALTGALMIGLGARAIHTISSFKWSRTIARSGFKPVLMVVLCLSLIVGIIVGVIVWDARDDVIQYYQLTSVLFVVVLVLIVPLGTAISFIYFAAYIVPIFLLYSQEGLSVDLRESPDHALKKWRRNLVYAVLLIGAGTTVIILLHTIGVEYAIDSLYRLAAGEKPLSPSQIKLTREVLISLALYALPLGLSFGVAAGLTLGGRMLIKHYTTRAVLWLWGLLPWHVIRFLDQTTALLLTKKSLGGYTFYHPIVHEYFTENYKSERASETNTDHFIHATRQP